MGLRPRRWKSGLQRNAETARALLFDVERPTVESAVEASGHALVGTDAHCEVDGTDSKGLTERSVV